MTTPATLAAQRETQLAKSHVVELEEEVQRLKNVIKRLETDTDRQAKLTADWVIRKLAKRGLIYAKTDISSTSPSRDQSSRTENYVAASYAAWIPCYRREDRGVVL